MSRSCYGASFRLLRLSRTPVCCLFIAIHTVALQASLATKWWNSVKRIPTTSALLVCLTRFNSCLLALPDRPLPVRTGLFSSGSKAWQSETPCEGFAHTSCIVALLNTRFAWYLFAGSVLSWYVLRRSGRAEDLSGGLLLNSVLISTSLSYCCCLHTVRLVSIRRQRPLLVCPTTIRTCRTPS